MPLETIILFLITDLTFCFTPGPATMVTISHALPPGRDGGLRGALGPIAGINVGNFIWYGLTAAGLVALIQTLPVAYAALRWVGVAYLVWIGAAMIRSKPSRLDSTKSRKASFARGFANGLAVHMSNPKALLFYTAFIPPFIDPSRSLWMQFGILATLTVFTETSGLTFYAALAARTRGLRQAREGARVFRKAAGVVVIAAAVILAWWNLNDTALAAFNAAKGEAR